MNVAYLLLALLPGSLACGGSLVGDGFIETPNYPSDYYNYADCYWFLKSNTSRGISIHFESFATEQNYDFVTIWEGWYETGPLLAREISGTRSPFYLDTFTSNEMLVFFHSDISEPAKGFRAYFSTTPCSDHVLTEPNGTITSPRFPNFYPNKVDCQWTIRAPEGARIQLSFTEFGTETGYDFIDVFDGASIDDAKILEHSGATLPADSVSSNNQMLVRFTTDAAGFSFSGWRATYAFIE